MAFAIIRKLSIWKGVTPRQPKKKVKGTHRTYYHLKDVSFLHHEPLLEEHRTIRVHGQKIKKAEAKKNHELANRLREKTPKPKIDMIIRQRLACFSRISILVDGNKFSSVFDFSLYYRYPRFVDALGELDDCLTMVHLFAALPASESKKIDVELVHKCRRYIILGICINFDHYV